MSAQAQGVVTSAEELAVMAAHLDGLVSRFVLDDAGSSAVPAAPSPEPTGVRAPFPRRTAA
jgi:hypothetical protein